MKNLCATYIAENIENIEGFDEALEELEKSHPKLKKMIMDAIWEYAEAEVCNNFMDSTSDYVEASIKSSLQKPLPNPKKSCL